MPQATLYAKALKDSGASLLCNIEGDVEVWIPKSEIDEDSEVTEVGDEGNLVIPQWLAEKEELV